MGAWPRDAIGLIEVVDATSGADVVLEGRPALRIRGNVDVAPGPRESVLTFPFGSGPPGPDGEQGPIGNAGATGPAGAAQAIGLHDTTHSPVGLWQFQGNLLDSSGHTDHLTVDVGTETYGAMAPGLVGVRLASTRLKSAVSANLRLTGDMSIAMLLMLEVDPTGAPVLTFTGGTNDTSDIYNFLYEISLAATRVPTWFSEHGTGVDDLFSPTTDAFPPKGKLIWCGATRVNNVVQFYSQGRALGAPSSALNAPTSGTASQLWVGGRGGTPPNSLVADTLIASLKITPTGLTAAQMKAEFNRTAGKFYGYVP